MSTRLLAGFKDAFPKLGTDSTHRNCSSANFTQDATTMTSERDNPFHIAQQQFDTAAELLDLPQDIREVLRVPQRELTVRFPVRLDDGTTKVYTGYRVQHSLGRGPTKGGIR